MYRMPKRVTVHARPDPKKNGSILQVGDTDYVLSEGETVDLANRLIDSIEGKWTTDVPTTKPL